MSIAKHIPNAITCCNLLCGCVSILFISANRPTVAAAMIFIAAFFDFLDGFAARQLNAKSPIGAELDSLSDVVSFGVAPSFVVAWFLNKMTVKWYVAGINILPMMAFFLAVFAAVRLAKFNIDTRQKSSFIGVPGPAAGMFIASLPFTVFSIARDGMLFRFVMNPYFFLAVIVILSWLMVSKIPFFSFKIKNLKFKDNVLRYFVVIFAIASIVILKWVALPFIFLFYILLSVICHTSE